MSKKDWLNEFVQKNAWGILFALVSISIWGASLAGRVDAVERDVVTLKEIVTRVVVLEEHDKSIISDINEIKADIKEIKQLLR